jgi:hypothetical protein
VGAGLTVIFSEKTTDYLVTASRGSASDQEADIAADLDGCNKSLFFR